MERFSFDLEKRFALSVRYLFHLPLVKKIKTGPRSFPTKGSPNTDKAMLDCSIVLLNTD